MSLRLITLLCLSLVAAAACSKNMKVDVRPPECTVDEKDCSTAPRDPKPMTDEPFFQRDKK